jgi:hypothetical protein
MSVVLWHECRHHVSESILVVAIAWCRGSDLFGCALLGG